eukprot:m.212075 g.212075  ORF g.212075 m.212075 type:complete len:298 (+) comp19467_c0_seq1:347-1240(+)
MAAVASAVKKAMPSIFISHGGGPAFFLKDQSNFGSEMQVGIKQLRELTKNLGLTEKPKAILLISAHWETSGPLRITSAPQPGLLYDYYGFPEEGYAPHLTYDCPGDPQLAQRIKSLLQAGGVDAVLDPKRQFDHGVFIPLKLVYPDASVPVVQVSLDQSLSPAFHWKLGTLLAPLREEGIMIIGSGQATHNMREGMKRMGRSISGRSSSSDSWAQEFPNWLTKIATSGMPVKAFEQAMLDWETAPGARMSHPREEHFIPFMVAAAAGLANRPDGTAARQVVDAYFVEVFSLASYAWL